MPHLEGIPLVSHMSICLMQLLSEILHYSLHPFLTLYHSVLFGETTSSVVGWIHASQ